MSDHPSGYWANRLRDDGPVSAPFSNYVRPVAPRAPECGRVMLRADLGLPEPALHRTEEAA